MKSGTRLFEQPPKSDEHSDAERQWDDQVIFPTVGHFGLLRTFVEPRNNRADGAGHEARAIDFHERRSAGDEQHPKRGDGAGRCLVGGQKLVETAFAFMRFVPSGGLRVGIRAILLSVVAYR